MATVSSQQALSRGDFRVEFRCGDSPMVCPHSARGWPCLGCVDLRRLGMLRAVVRRPMCQPTWDARACICTHDIENWRAAVLVRAGLVLATSAWQVRLPDACAGGVAPSNMTHPDGHSAGSRRAQAHADLSTPSHAYRPERGHRCPWGDGRCMGDAGLGPSKPLLGALARVLPARWLRRSGALASQRGNQKERALSGQNHACFGHRRTEVEPYPASLCII